MNEITERFLAYRAKPKRRASPPPPKPIVKYAVEGFVSPKETVLERMGRLVEALARGEWLSKENNQFFHTHRWIQRGPMRSKLAVLERTQLRRDDRMLTRITAQTKLQYRG
jgi:hypothetical protein